MARALLVAGAMIAALWAGCVSTPAVPQEVATNVLNLLAGPALYSDPQNEPHPAFKWPTLSHPSVGPLPEFWIPINASAVPAHIAGMQHLAQAPDLTSGAGIALFGRLAVVPEGGTQVNIVDIQDPSAPVVLSSVNSSGRGAAIIAYPDGRLVTVVSTGAGFDVINITDPYEAEQIASVKPTQAGHKLGVVPGTPIVYNAASDGGRDATSRVSPANGLGVTEIYDLTDPEKPVKVQDWKNGYSCHHVFFWNDASKGKSRAICAGLEYTQIWDTKDPRNPTVIVSVPVHHGVANGPSGRMGGTAFSHSAGLNLRGDILYVGDEMGGGGAPPGCVASTEVNGGMVSTPFGATWFYDVSTETEPRLLGYYSPSYAPGKRSCTTHHGRLVPNSESRDLLAMSYYNDGVVLLDFTGIDASEGVLPKVVDHWEDGSDTWETWYYQGYLFTGDLDRGMDVLKFR